MPRKDKNQILLPLDTLGAGDTELITDLLPADLASTAFDALLAEVDWRTMVHRGGEVPRRIAVQGELVPLDSESTAVGMGSGAAAFPIYRHPADSPPDLHQGRFTPTVAAIRAAAEARVGHPLNHVLIQHYRGGHDYISEHSDKTLDVVRGGGGGEGREGSGQRQRIVNVSLGAERVMTLRRKKDPRRAVVAREQSEDLEDAGDAVKSTRTSGSNTNRPPQPPPPRPTQRIPLPHNSLFAMGLETNRAFLHGIHHDNRPAHTKSAAERAFGGARISLTFRQIGTFLVPTSATSISPTASTAASSGSSSTAAATDSEPRYLIYGQGATAKTREEARPVPAHGALGGDSDEATTRAEVEALLKAFGEENFQSVGFDWEEWYGRGFDVIHMTSASS